MYLVVVAHLFVRHDCSTGSLGIQQSDDSLGLQRLIRKRSARSLSRRFLDIPTGRDQSEKRLAESQRRLDGEMREIVQGEMRGMPPLLLPRDRAIGARAAQHASAVRSFYNLHPHFFIIRRASMGTNWEPNSIDPRPTLRLPQLRQEPRIYRRS